jgi:hypothetical protein|tara:strand:+ start:262 stop:468 length:207 start_codon:yes stop_codon:yes gene_type:complete
MKEVLEFVFSSFWHWLGVFVLLAVFVRWRLFYFSINMSADKPKKKNPSTFWKDLANLKDSKEDIDPEK